MRLPLTWLLAVVLFGPAQTVEHRSAVSGVVIDATTGRPVAGALVTIRMPGGPVRGGYEAVAQQITDEAGRFVMTRLKASDQCLISAGKDGYAGGDYGQASRGGFGKSVTLADGQWFNAGEIKLFPPAALSGTITDGRGEPMPGVYVRVFPRLMVAGVPQFVGGPVTTTDDRGVYRIAGLMAGGYVVCLPSVQQTIPTMAVPADAAVDPVTPDGILRGLNQRTPAIESAAGFRRLLGQYVTPPDVTGRAQVDASTCFPSSRTPGDATAIALADGEERGGIDMQWRSVPAVNVSGTVVGLPEALAGLSLRLLAKGSEGLGNGSETATSLVAPDGRFMFLGVPAGEYTIDASQSLAEYSYSAPLVGGGFTSLPAAPGPRSSGPSFAVYSAPAGTMLRMQTVGPARFDGRQPLTVGDRDVTSVTVTLHPTITLSGRIVSEAAAPATTSPVGLPTTVLADPANGDPSLGAPQLRISSTDPAQDFTLGGLRLGEYFLRVSFTPGTVVKSITWQGRDYTYRPFDTTSGANIADILVTMTDKIPKVSGTVRDDRGQSLDAGAVFLFPVEREQWTKFGFRPARVGAAEIAKGAYRLSVPAGSYYAIAVGPADSEGWKDPAFLEAASRVATRLVVDWGQTLTQDLVLRKIR